MQGRTTRVTSKLLGPSVLFLGVGQRNFLQRLEDSLRIVYPDIQVSLHEPQHPPSAGSKQRSEEHQQLPRLGPLLKALLPAFAPGFGLARDLIVILSLTGRIRPVLSYAYSSVMALSSLKPYLHVSGPAAQYDLVHFHYLTWFYLRWARYIPKDVPLVASFWGSDLLRVGGTTLDHYFVSRVLERADVITVQSEQLRQIVLAKFGRSLSHKTLLARFPLNESALEAIDVAEVKDRPQTDQLTVTLGHNGNPENRHLEILEAVARIEPDVRINALWLIPCTYGGDEEYIQSVFNRAEELGLRFHIIRDYMGPREMAQLWVGTDVFVHVPSSDALSAALTEAIYAGCRVITGDWLPYDSFRSAGLEYVTVPFSLAPLSTMLRDLITGHAAVEPDACTIAGQRIRIRQHFTGSSIANEWLEVYKFAL